MGSFQTLSGMRSSALLETSCGYLLQELQMIWDEVGESRFEREKVLLQLEQECLEAYRRKVDCANISRTRLHQELAEAEAEFTHLLLSLGEQSLPGRPEKMVGTLKQQLDSITPALREMRLRKDDRVNKFRALQGQIQKISAEIAGQSEYDGSITNTTVNEKDLSLKKLEEYQNELQTLQKDKNNRLRKVEKYIDAIIAVAATLGMESSMIITKVHPSLNELCGICKNISDGILMKLESSVESLEKEKQKRLEKLQHLGKALTNLWNLIETPYKERRQFYQIVNLLTVSSAELSDSGSLTLDIIQQAEAEVRRLDKLKAAKINELFLKKQKELEDICSKSHMKVTSNLDIEKIINLVNYGGIGHADLLVSMDEQISKAKEEASSRKPIMEKMDKWIMARDEERWLEEYNRDDNKYTVSRGAHKNLKRAERARVTVNKIPALVDSLVTQTKSWEEGGKRVFLYDEVPLLAMLEEYNMLRKKREDEKQRQREDEKQRQRERKKVESQLASRQENIFGSRPPSSHRHLPDRSLNGGYSNPRPLNRELSLAIQVQHLESNSINSAAQAISHIKGRSNKEQGERTLCAPNLNFHRRDENVSVVSMYSGPLSP